MYKNSVLLSHPSTNFVQYKMYPARRAADYSYIPTYGYGMTNSNINSYPPPSRGIVGDMWRQPQINDRSDVSYDYLYKEHEHKTGRGDFSEFSAKGETWKLGGETRMNEVVGMYGRGRENEYIYSQKYGGTSTGYTGSMTGATNNIGTAVELLMDAASGSSGKSSSRIGELESPVNYYPTMPATMDPSKRYGNFSLAPRRSSMGGSANYY